MLVEELDFEADEVVDELGLVDIEELDDGFDEVKDVEVEALVDDSFDDVEDTEEDVLLFEVVDVVLEELDETGASPYISSLFPAPQYSRLFPGHKKLQSPLAARTDPAPRLLPQ